jgi:hypothetical protein
MARFFDYMKGFLKFVGKKERNLLGNGVNSESKWNQ